MHIEFIQNIQEKKFKFERRAYQLSSSWHLKLVAGKARRLLVVVRISGSEEPVEGEQGRGVEDEWKPRPAGDDAGELRCCVAVIVFAEAHVPRPVAFPHAHVVHHEQVYRQLLRAQPPSHFDLWTNERDTEKRLLNVVSNRFPRIKPLKRERQRVREKERDNISETRFLYRKLSTYVGLIYS